MSDRTSDRTSDETNAGMNDKISESRRRFAKSLTAAAIAAPVVAAAARAQTTPAPKEATAPPNPQPTPAPQQQQPRPSPVAEAYAGVARARFGELLSEEQLTAVRRDLEGNVRSSERLRAFKLKNSDEPDFVFIP